MMRIAAALALAGALIGLSPAAAAPQFPALTGRVVDDAHMLSAPTVQKLDQDLAALEQQTGRQVVVATVGDLQGYDIAEYGYQLGRTWAIGRKGVNDGAILLVAPNDRKVRIEVGYGLEPVLTDALSSVILQTKVLPRFREGKMEQGVLDGAEAVIQQLALPDDQAKANVAQATQAHDQRGGSPIGLIITLLIIFWIIGSVLRGFGRRRYGGSGLWWLLPMMMSGRGGGGGGWGGGGWGGGGGGFSGGGGSFGGGGSSGSW